VEFAVVKVEESARDLWTCDDWGKSGLALLEPVV